jgi:CheY-like chemotaxis protein
MGDSRSARLFAALRAAAHQNGERFLVGLASEDERRRVAMALSAEGRMLEERSTHTALERLAQEPFELSVLDLDERRDRNPLSAGRELRPFTDLVFLMDDDPFRCGEAFAAEVAAILPRPLPDSDALFRAHLRWLAACRRARTRGMLLKNVFVRQQEELTAVEPALAHALGEIVAEAKQEPTVMVMGDLDLVRVSGGRPVETAPDVAVLGLGPADNLESRLREARDRTGGAAVVVVDGAPAGQRMANALYAGARAYLDRAHLPFLGRIVACAALRRRAEVSGRRLIQTLARFGVLEEGAPSGARTVPRDVDARLIAAATSQSDAMVPSGHEVLVVDDEVVVLTVLREAVRRGGYRVTTAASGEEAIDLMQRRRFDLVLTDKNLPGISGLEVLRVARTLDPPPAVVLITGYSSYGSAMEALDIGAHDYVEKPIRDLENLRFRIRRALSRRDEQISRRPGEVAGRPARVLLVEVEGRRRQLLADFLGRTYQVTPVADGDEALRCLEQERYDIVLADRNLPGMSGLRVIEQAQRLLPHCASVLYTAYPPYETVKEAFEIGVDAFFVRPSEELQNLADKVAEAVRGRGGILLG